MAVSLVPTEITLVDVSISSVLLAERPFFSDSLLIMWSSKEFFRSNPIVSDSPDKDSDNPGASKFVGGPVVDPKEVDSVIVMSNGAASFLLKISLKEESDILLSRLGILDLLVV